MSLDSTLRAAFWTHVQNLAQPPNVENKRGQVSLRMGLFVLRRWTDLGSIDSLSGVSKVEVATALAYHDDPVVSTWAQDFLATLPAPTLEEQVRSSGRGP